MTHKPVEVAVERVSKRFGSVWAVNDVCITAQSGQFLTLLGPSGCGKTTILRLIAGFEELDQGEIFLDQVPISNIPPWKRQQGFVFQNYALFPHLTVAENIAFGLRMQRAHREEIGQRTADILKLVNLPGMGDRYPRQLSGGQQQRVALARSLVLRPKVLLLDEPLSNLDAKLRTEMLFELKQLQRNLGVTTIYVTHDQAEALAMSDIIVVLKDGQVRQVGTPREIWEQPCSAFVAGFLSMENLIPGQVVAKEEDSYLQLRFDTEQTVSLEVLDAREIDTEDQVTLGIRANSIQLRSRTGPVAHKNAFPAEIIETSYKGDFVSYEICTPMTTKPFLVTAPSSQTLSESLEIYLDPKKLFVFKDEN
jgi:putative spermidine/putrescine transport system ATP-binding protein